MFGLSPLGVFHTAVSLIAVVAGLIALVRDRQISPINLNGKIYVIATVITCLTGFGIFHHGGITVGHILGVITLVVLGGAAAAGAGWFGRLSRYVQIVSYSMTFFFHIIPSVVETTTRLPLGAPLVASPEAPELQKTIGAFFVAFLIGATMQVMKLRRKA